MEEGRGEAVPAGSPACTEKGLNPSVLPHSDPYARGLEETQYTWLLYFQGGNSSPFTGIPSPALGRGYAPQLYPVPLLSAPTCREQALTESRRVKASVGP